MANLIEAGRLAAEHGAWVILPEADDEWNENPDKSDGTDDVGFLSQLITTATMLRPIDPKRVYLPGMSNGGFMVERLACARPDLIAGAAIVAATLGKSQRSEAHTSALQSLLRITYAVVCWKTKKPL